VARISAKLRQIPPTPLHHAMRIIIFTLTMVIIIPA